MPADSKTFDDFRWADIGDGFCWEFAADDGDGPPAAEVSFQEELGQRWSWYVPLDDDWHYGHSPNPCGLARSADAAKAICEAILRGTSLKP